jgi:hypothetical protein
MGMVGVLQQPLRGELKAQREILLFLAWHLTPAEPPPTAGAQQTLFEVYPFVKTKMRVN